MWRLGEREVLVRVAPGRDGGSARHSVRSRGLLECVCLAMEIFCQAVPIALSGSEALGAWRYASPARRSGSELRVASRVPCQVILLLYLQVVDSVCVIYKAFGDAPKVGLLVFLELWLRTYPLSCGSGWGLKHVVFLELWLGIASLELGLGMAVEHKELLSCGSGW